MFDQHDVLRHVTIGIAYLVTLRLGYLFVDSRNHLAAIWPASGLAIGVLLARVRREWPAIGAVLATASFASNVAATGNAGFSAILAVTNLVEYLGIALVLYAALAGPPNFACIRHTLRFLAIVALVEVAPAAIAAGAIASGHGTPFAIAFRSWWASDTLGILVVAPLIVAWQQRQPRRPLSVATTIEIGGFVIGWCAVTLLAFHGHSADAPGLLSPYMLVPMIVWAALRFGVRGVTTSVLIVASIAIASTVSGTTAFPLGGESASMRLLRVQTYVAVALGTGLLLLGARRTMDDAVEASRQGAERLDRALAAANMGTWEWDLMTGVVQWSSSVSSMFGIPSDGYDRGLDWYFESVHPADRPGLITAIHGVLAGNGDCRNEHRLAAPDGTMRWLEVRGRAMFDRSGRATRVVGTVLDATARRAARESLRRASRAMKTLSSCNQVLIRARQEQELLDGICRTIVDEGGYRLAWVGFAVDEPRPAIRVMAQWGFEAGELENADVMSAPTRHPSGILATALREGVVQASQDIESDPRAPVACAAGLAHGCRSALNLPLLRDDKPFGVISVYADEKGAFDEEEVALLRELANDLAFGLEALRTRVDHERAELELAARETLLGHLIRHTPAAVAMFDTQMRYLQASESWIRDYQLSGDIIGRIHYDVFPDLPQKWKDVHQRILAGGPVESCDEDPFPRPDGSLWWLQWEVRPWHTSDGTIGGLTMFTQLITERKQNELALQQARRRADAIIESAMDGIVTVDPQGEIQVFNPAAERMFRCSAADAVGRPIDEFIPEPPGGSGGNLVTKFSRVHSRNQISGAFGEVIGRRLDDSVFPIEAFISRTDLDGQPLLTITLRDVTERFNAERALRESEERFRQVVENIQEVFWMSDADRTRLLYVSPAYEKICGRTCASLYLSPESWMDAIHPEDRDGVRRAVSLRLGRGDYHEEYRIVRPDGTIRWVQERAVPVRGIDGKVYRLVGVAEDVTERRRIEDQFRQSQKMEAIGQLAGGVAHDFNNILGAIMMAAGEIGECEGLPSDAQDLVRDVHASAERASNLTRQLLLFSRRQVMHLRELNLNDVVTNVARMLRRIVGEDVSIVMQLAQDALTVQADAGMLEQVLVNMAVNARDAMPSGGHLVIETYLVDVDEEQASRYDDASPGRHVCLSVRDSGLGVSPDVLNRIFEPFFTTKEPGRGTGLGLATVFGIVKQHRGWITVNSEVGQGTTFEVYLRAAVATAPTVGLLSAPASPKGGTETILLVEDDADVRKFTRMVLQRAGYNVVDASSGVEAERIWDAQTSRVHLLLTDMVMPDGLNGRELARRLRAKDAGLRVIVTSGYNHEFAGRSVEADEGDDFIQKPWKPQQMLEAVRRCLDA